MSEEIGEIFTLDEVAKYLKVGKRTIYLPVGGEEDPCFQGGRGVAFYPGGYRSLDRTTADRISVLMQVSLLAPEGRTGLSGFCGSCCGRME